MEEYYVHIKRNSRPINESSICIGKSCFLTFSDLAIGSGIENKIDGSRATALIIPNEEINEILNQAQKIVQALKDSNNLLKGITKTIKN